MLAIPNFSEGRDPHTIESLAQALTSVEGVRLLDVHTDPDHNRTVYTLSSGDQRTSLADALTAGAARAIELLDIATHDGLHPHIGMLDVAPIVYMHDAERVPHAPRRLCSGSASAANSGCRSFSTAY